MKKLGLLLLGFLFLNTVFAQENDFFNKADVFFKTYVKDGKVAYDKIKKNEKELDVLLALAQNVNATKDDLNMYKAYWFNAYNLSVIKNILDHYPTKSPLDNKGFFDKDTFKFCDGLITLNDIENKKLRTLKDPRIHFALVCGAIGCPPIISEAYLPNTVDKQLTKQARLAMNGDYFIKVNDKKKTVFGSEILKWYKGDFTLNGKTEIDFINQFRDKKIPTNYKLAYFPYNWKLNKQ